MAQAQAVVPQDMMAPQHHPAQPPPGAPGQVGSLPNINTYYPDTAGDLSASLPMNLDSLRDGPPGSKPFYPYSTLIRYAIKGAPNQKLLLEDIYYAIESRFPYFRTAPPGWKNSVRHNLSLNPCFEKVPRPLTDRGKGSYWTVNDNVDPRTGVHRVRKKKKSGKGRGHSSQGDQSPEEQQGEQQGDIPQDVDYHSPETATYPDPTFVPPPIIAAEGPGSSRQPAFQAPQQPYGTFDPTFAYAMRYPPPIFPDETPEFDEHGQVNWASMWQKELDGLMAYTQQQEKAGADQEWYRSMLARLRHAMVMPPEHLVQPPPMAPPPNPAEVPVNEQ